LVNDRTCTNSIKDFKIAFKEWGKETLEVPLVEK
jgi:hypothetical protein